MNVIMKKHLLAWDKSIPEMHFKQPKFTYSAIYLEHDGYQHGIASMLYIYFDKKIEKKRNKKQC